MTSSTQVAPGGLPGETQESSEGRMNYVDRQIAASCRRLLAMLQRVNDERFVLSQLIEKRGSEIRNNAKLRDRIRVLEEQVPRQMRRAKPVQRKLTKKPPWHVIGSEMLDLPAYIRDAIKPGGLIG